jgi:hypothetical protein
VPAEDAFHRHPDPGSRARPDRPVDRHVLAHCLDQFAGDRGQLLVAHDLDRAFIRRQRIVEGQRVAQAPVPDDVGVAGALGGGLARGDVGTADVAVADLLQSLERGFFDVGFGEFAHADFRLRFRFRLRFFLGGSGGTGLSASQNV